MTLPLVVPPAAAKDDIEALAAAAAYRKLGMCAAFHDLSRDDLRHEAIVAILTLKAQGRFDGDVSTFSTFASLVAGRRLIDLWRRRSRQARREGEYAEVTWGLAKHVQYPAANQQRDTHLVPVDNEAPIDSLTADEPELAKPLADWLAGVYLAAKRKIEWRKAQRRGRHFIPCEQAVAIGLLMVRENIAADDCRKLFLSRADLCRAVHFLRPGESHHPMHVPPVSFFSRAWIICAELLDQPGARAAFLDLAPIEN